MPSHEPKHPIRSSAAEYLTFVAATGDGAESMEMRYEDENIWLTQKMMAALYDVSVSAINQHLKTIFEDGELDKEAVIKKYLITASDGKQYNTNHYNLQAIIAVGFAVKAYIASGYQANQTIRKLGYPSHEALRGWYREYRENGDLHREFIRAPLHTEEQKAAAVAHYYANGCNYTQTSKALGYVDRERLRQCGIRSAGGPALYLQAKCRKMYTRTEARSRGGILRQRRRRRKDRKQIRSEPLQPVFLAGKAVCRGVYR